MSALMLWILCACAVGFPEESNQTGSPPRVVPSLDLARYMGTWYEIARLPNRFQKTCVGDVTATYTLLESGDVEVINRCRKEKGEWTEAKGIARRLSADEPNSKLQVRFAPAWLSFLPFVWGDYWVIDLAEDYSFAVVGDPDREYLWLLARTPSFPDSTLAQLLDRAREEGFDVSQVSRTVHGNRD